MNITKLKHKNGTNVSKLELSRLCRNIMTRTKAAGFITEAEVKTESSIKIGINKRCFVVNPKQQGYNARFGAYIKSSKGYKRTIISIWEQREEFNHIINDLLDSLNMLANIKSGPYIVRTVNKGRVNEWDCVTYYGEPAEPDIVSDAYGNALVQMCREKDVSEFIDVEGAKQAYKDKSKAIRERKKERIGQLRASNVIYLQSIHYKVRSKSEKLLNKRFTFDQIKDFPKEDHRYLNWETEQEYYIRMLGE